MKPATSNLARSWSLPRPIINSHQKKKWLWLWAREAPQNLEVAFNIYAMAEASNFKFGKHLGFAKARHKTTPREKSGRGVGLGKLPNIWGSPLIFLQRLCVSGASCSSHFQPKWSSTIYCWCLKTKELILYTLLVYGQKFFFILSQRTCQADRKTNDRISTVKYLTPHASLGINLVKIFITPLISRNPNISGRKNANPLSPSPKVIRLWVGQYN